MKECSRWPQAAAAEEIGGRRTRAMENRAARITKCRHGGFSEASKVGCDQKKGKESEADFISRIGVKHNLSSKRQGKPTAHRNREAVKDKRIGVSVKSRPRAGSPQSSGFDAHGNQPDADDAAGACLVPIPRRYFFCMCPIWGLRGNLVAPGP